MLSAAMELEDRTEQHRSTLYHYKITQRTRRNSRYVESYAIRKAGLNIGNMYIKSSKKMLHFASQITQCTTCFKNITLYLILRVVHVRDRV